MKPDSSSAIVVRTVGCAVWIVLAGCGGPADNASRGTVQQPLCADCGPPDPDPPPPHPPPPPPPPPGDVYDITPDPTRHQTEYRNVVFRPGDEVFVSAGGCVQTGGSGSTWKRFVNPSGGNSDRLYHGLIWIPGSTAGLEAIGGVINRSPVIVPSAPPGSDPGQMFLRIGYDDDNFSDNGYWGHDNGTENQCLGVGNAWVHLRVVHHTPPLAAKPCNTSKAMDLYWTGLDPNFLPLNPVWSQQCTAPAFAVNVLNTCGYLGLNSVFALQLGNPPCTTFTPTTDTKDDPIICHAEAGAGVNGHVNWGYAAYEGSLTYQEYSGDFLGFLDDDWSLELIPDGRAGLSAGNAEGALELEFNQREVFGGRTTGLSTFWDQMMSLDDPGRRNLLKNMRAFAVGVIGVDNVHNSPPNGPGVELHPVLGVAFHIRSSLSEDVWGVIVRRSGNEGGCSHDVLAPLHSLEANELRLLMKGNLTGGGHVDWSRSRFINTQTGATVWPTPINLGGGQVVLPIALPAYGQAIVGEIHFTP